MSLFPYGKSGLKFPAALYLRLYVASLPVWEEWIEMCSSLAYRGTTGRSLPVWEEWIEISSSEARKALSKSLPVWEEWIEIPLENTAYTAEDGLFPYGKSGLKYARQHVLQDRHRSLPVWEEWIEIYREGARVLSPMESLPVWEEWIEIEDHGHRAGQGHVSSRMGRVD